MYYYPLSAYLQETFGEKLYKLALDGGMTCPNRDGTCGTRGCIFCSEGGSGEFAEPRHVGLPTDPEGIREQIACAKRRIAGKTKAKRFIAYFQSYTNTYAPVALLEALFSEAIDHPEVAALSIATRPDCIDVEKAALLKCLNQKKPVWVELGLQTIHERSAAYIRRGYALPVFSAALAQLDGLHTVAHMILGLPGESRADMTESIRYVAASGVKGIKLHLLHVLRGTDLDQAYLLGKVPVMTLPEYADLVTDLLEYLPSGMVVHRMTGDGPKRLLRAPLWSGNKKKVLNTIQRELYRKDIQQGRLYSPFSLTESEKDSR